MSDRHGFAHRLAAASLRVALVTALGAAVWGVYRRLPEGEHTGAAEGRQQRPTLLHLRLRTEEVGLSVSAKKIPLQLYPINMVAARNEFDSERRPGQRFEDFATRLMGERQPLGVELDEHGEATIAVPPGKWWVHATVEGDRELTWRLAVNVSGREKTVELTKENAYLRAKRF
ncbi:MAG: hypothetical protein QOJ70_890 [Acidobacteriota bacterium]|jgi:hypothetical protein|nr:hypothetical protein [Acidobacteriota bacterium]